MSPFRRTLKYPFRYKRYFLAVMACVLVGGLCYGGGIGSIYPILKLIISDEGLHGLADIRLTEDMLGIKIETDNFTPEIKVELDAVNKKSTAEKIGLKPQHIITKLNGKPVHLPDFTRLIAEMQPGQEVSLTWIEIDGQGRTFEGTIRLAEPRLSSRLLFSLTNLLPRDEDRFTTLSHILIAFWLINMLQLAMRFVQEYCAGIMIERGFMDLRNRLYHKALNLPISFYGSQVGSAGVSSRFIRDASAARRGINILLTQAILEPFKLLVALTLALLLAWKLTLILLAVAPVIWLLIAVFGKIMKKATKRSLQIWGRVLSLLNETLGNIRVVKAYGAETYERKRFLRTNRGLLKYLIRIARINALTSPTIGVLGITMATLGLLFACREALPPNKSMEPEELFAFFGAILGMAESLRKLSSMPNRIQAGNAASARIFSMMDELDERHTSRGPQLTPFQRQFEFQDVTFTYPGTSTPALSQINLVVGKGKTVALVGPNGSGKTTLISLLPRFFNPGCGRIMFDDFDISEVSLRSLRSKFALVNQQTVVFADTVRANIAYGRPNTPIEKVVAAAKQAYAHEFIEQLPDGYDTVLTEAGKNLSGGQRQRISIARAILRDPEILILDEATSNIDADSESKITKALRHFTADRTCLVVAHRLATIMSADTIVVMDHGSIIARGDHQSLLATCPLYHGLYETQMD